MRFDWYQATVPEAPIWLREALAERSAGEWFAGKPQNGYARGEELVTQGGQVLLNMYSGGYHDHPHLKASGSNAHEAAELIREVAPDHSVARADVAVDLVAPGFFDRAFPELVTIAREQRVKPMRAGDWDSLDLSRTFYLGAPQSDVRIRAYEKGQEVMQKYGCLPDGIENPRDWTRIEVQVRPKSKHKAKAAGLAAVEFWGASRASRQVAARLLTVDAPRVAMGTIWKGLQDLERTEMYCYKQYYRMFERLAHLDDAALGARIRGSIQRLREMGQI